MIYPVASVPNVKRASIKMVPVNVRKVMEVDILIIPEFPSVSSHLLLKKSVVPVLQILQ